MRSASHHDVKVLVVEDEPDLRELYRENLTEAGYDVVTARNGAEGLARLVQGPVDLAVVDLMMPVMDGYEFIQRLHETPGREKTPTLVVSAVATGAYSERIGATAFIPKPFDADELISAVERYAA